MRSIVAFVVFALALALPQIAAAQAVPDSDRTTVQGVIASQLDAFKSRDGQKAYSFAAPNIRAIFPSAERFVAMVETGYPPVYTPRSYTFGKIEAKDGGYSQTVEILGPDGSYWTALYSLSRQDDGTWKITGCFLMKSAGAAA